MRSTDNHTQFTTNYYPPTKGHEFKPGVARTIPHTDESLITLLLTSPGQRAPPSDAHMSRGSDPAGDPELSALTKTPCSSAHIDPFTNAHSATRNS